MAAGISTLLKPKCSRHRSNLSIYAARCYRTRRAAQHGCVRIYTYIYFQQHPEWAVRIFTYVYVHTRFIVNLANTIQPAELFLSVDISVRALKYCGWKTRLSQNAFRVAAPVTERWKGHKMCVPREWAQLSGTMALCSQRNLSAFMGFLCGFLYAHELKKYNTINYVALKNVSDKTQNNICDMPSKHSSLASGLNLAAWFLTVKFRLTIRQKIGLVGSIIWPIPIILLWREPFTYFNARCRPKFLSGLHILFVIKYSSSLISLNIVSITSF